MALDRLDLIETFGSSASRNKYSVVNARGEPVFYVDEESGFCSRYCFGSYRGCKFLVYDGSRREILRMSRPLRCDSCCCPCWLQKLEVYSGDTLIGSVVQDWSLWRPSFSVRDAAGDTVLFIIGPCVRPCADAIYQVKSLDGQHRVGMIKKKWGGIGQEFSTFTSLFDISFPLDLDVKIKAVLLGAGLLMDFMYFEQEKKI